MSTRPQMIAAARFRLREMLTAKQAASVLDVAAMAKTVPLHLATLEALRALPQALTVLGIVLTDEIQIRVHPVGVVIALPLDSSVPVAVVAPFFLECMPAPIAVYDWILKRYNAAKFGRVSLLTPVRWSWWLAQEEGETVTMLTICRDTADSDEQEIIQELPGCGWRSKTPQLRVVEDEETENDD